ncbi:nitrous oxide reductase accessory protein NosL [Paenibacillus sp. 1P07SE]|uniref:nitrous oxide reductase accessory protein NosL n=1 Tax=Paenibacillus sp. 1P07SE TaxID=3132209 RepID=UPI0039A4B7D4
MKMRRWSMAAAVLLTMLLVAACGGPSYEPQPVNEATDRCAICNMAIKDDEFATQIITKDGQSLKFDDIGCMHKWKTEYGTETVGAEFVRDYTNSKWLKYEDAYYVYDADIQTPMAYGIVSFEGEAEAEAFIAERGAGELMTAADLASHTWAVNREMMEMSGMEGHSHSHDGEHHEEGAHGGSTAHDTDAESDHEESDAPADVHGGSGEAGNEGHGDNAADEAAAAGAEAGYGENDADAAEAGDEHDGTMRDGDHPSGTSA